MTFAPSIRRTIERWQGADFDEKTREEIKELLRTNPKEVRDAFDGRLAFGTGGMRGIVGVGTNRMNFHTVSWATQGIANFLKGKFPTITPLIAIACDTRLFSRKFAQTVARTFAGNNMRVVLFKDFCPTPQLSFTCRQLRCQAGVMITASHNPANYNGYKVYAEDGSQVVYPDDEQIVDLVSRIESPSDVSTALLDDARISYVEDETIQAYFAAIDATNPDPALSERAALANVQVLVAYSPLHGAGSRCTPEALRRWGVRQLTLVEAQMTPDGHFPTVELPNPEEEGALKLGIDALLSSNGDLLIANDPDSDRMGAVARVGPASQILTGNESGALILYHLCSSLQEQGRLPKSGAVVKSLVTSDFLKAIAEHFELRTFDVLPGFKYIAELDRKWRLENAPWKFLFGAEESLGYLTGNYARDKDGVQAACLIAQCALRAKLDGKSLIEQLHALYAQFGVYREKHVNLAVQPGKAGQLQMVVLMDQLRTNPPKELAGLNIARVENPLETTGPKEAASILIWSLGNVGKLIARPSGTEPKIKFYLFAHMPSAQNQGVEISLRIVDQLLEQMASELRQLLKTYVPS